MTEIQLSEIIIEHKNLIGVLHWLSRRVFLISCAVALSILGGGCIGVIGVMATAQWSVDPAFAKTHDLKFKPPSTETKAVLLFETKGSVQKDLFRQAFLEALKNSGAFSEVAAAKNDRDLQKYSGWDVVRVQLAYLGNDQFGGGIDITTLAYKLQRQKYDVKVRFEFQSSHDAGEYSYSPAIWISIHGAISPTDEAHPLTGDQNQARKLFAQELVLAACSEAQRSGRSFR